MPKADLILKNADVITMNPAQPRASVVAIKGNRILVVGDSTELDSLTGAKTRVIDCCGKTIVPGFNDAHCHIYSYIRKLMSVDLSPAAGIRTINDIKAAIRQKALSVPPGTWISGTGFNEFYLAKKRCPDRWDIDEVTPDHPVVLSQRSLHACVLNSLALELAGITNETPEPPGTMIERDLETGEPSGRLYEMLGYIREKVMPPISQEEMDRSAASANKHYLSLGITSLQDATISNDIGRWQTYRRLKAKGVLKSRLTMMLRTEALSQFRETGIEPGTGDSQLRLGAIKIIVNESTGQLYPPQAELNQMVFDAHKVGYQVAIHTIEPNTVEAAITALEYAQNQLPQTGHRHRIEHCAVCTPPLLERLSKLKAVVVTQPPFIYYSGERYLATVPRVQLPWLYRIKSPLGRGIVVAGSSDSPIVPNNPLMGMYAAITRLTESGQYLLPEEYITAEQALALYTTNAAYASFEENIKGSIAAGKLADIVILSDNPLKSPPERLKEIRVETTIIDGKIVWEI